MALGSDYSQRLISYNSITGYFCVHVHAHVYMCECVCVFSAHVHTCMYTGLCKCVYTFGNQRKMSFTCFVCTCLCKGPTCHCPSILGLLVNMAMLSICVGAEDLKSWAPSFPASAPKQWVIFPGPRTSIPFTRPASHCYSGDKRNCGIFILHWFKTFLYFRQIFNI